MCWHQPNMMTVLAGGSANFPPGTTIRLGGVTASDRVKKTRRPKKKKTKKEEGTGCQKKVLGLGPEPGGSDGAPSTIDAMEGVTY